MKSDDFLILVLDERLANCPQWYLMPPLDINMRMDAYLIESRSIGGLSGSPVFAISHNFLRRHRSIRGSLLYAL